MRERIERAAAASTRARYHRELPHALGNRETLALLRRRAPLAVDDLGKSAGRELDRETRTAIAPRLAGVTGSGSLEHEADRAAASRAEGPSATLGPVRIHTDAQAQRSAAQLGARAFTIGSDVYFARDEYRPHTAEGQALLAHELAHVVQQQRRGQRLIQCKKYPLDPGKPTGDQVEAATEAEAKQARAIYDRIVVTYGIDFDSAGSAAAQNAIYNAHRPKFAELDLDRTYRPVAVVAWTLAELEELERALARYRALVVVASPSDAVRVGPRIVGRIDRPAETPSMMKELGGEVTDLYRITLYDAMGADASELMIHELGHVFFRGLAQYFAMLPFWQLFPERKDADGKPIKPQADYARYQKIWAHLQTQKLPPGSPDWGAFEAPVSEYGFENPGEDVAEAVTFYVVHELILKDGLMKKKFPFRYAIVNHAWEQAQKLARTTSSLRKGP